MRDRLAVVGLHLAHVAAGTLDARCDDEHRYFRPPPERPRVVHVHVCTAGSCWERDHLLLRDYLRRDTGAAAEYAQVKAEMARRWRDDRIAYTEAKTTVIVETLARAETWAADAGWTAATSTAG